VRIIGTLSSPFTRKVRIVALERRILTEFVIDSPLSEDSQVPTLNPLGKVPVLVKDDGSVLVDSPLIVAFMDGLGQGERLIPAADPERTAVLQWEAIADGVLDAAVLVRMEQLRPESERGRAWMDRQKGKVERGLAWLDRELGNREWCIGGRLSLADIALGCCAAYLEFRFEVEGWGRQFENVARVAAVLEQRPSFRATVLQG